MSYQPMPHGGYTGSPDQLLAQSSWRRRNSVWILGVAVGFGVLSFIAFIVVAARVKSKRMWRAAAISGAAGAVAMVVSSATNPDSSEATETSGIGGTITLVIWIGLIIYAFTLNREYLTWKAHQENGGVLGVNEPHYPQYQPKLPPYQAPRAQPFTQYAQPLPNMPLVGLNHATITDLAVTGLGEETAARILLARDLNGGFTNLDEVVAHTTLAPHEVEVLRTSVTFEA